MSTSKLLVYALAFLAADAQQAGKLTLEAAPELQMMTCYDSSDSCTVESFRATLDANWRWLHRTDGWQNCFDGSWLCGDEVICASECALEGVDAQKYAETYGVSRADRNSLRLAYVTGSNVGSRLYATTPEGSFRLFRLKNREITFSLDVSELPCGLNSAVYFFEADALGGLGRGRNGAGAAFGTGYGDAQCPTDVKFINGTANVRGEYGNCAAEIDIFEGNREAMAYTMHPCSIQGQRRCRGDECQDVCDKSGCDFNSYRAGFRDFYGPGKVIDTTKAFELTTQFLTDTGSDEGSLMEVRQLYSQNGQVLPAPGTITDSECAARSSLYGDRDIFASKGGLRSMGEALDRGVVLVLSIWDDGAANMLWLDSTYPPGSSAPGSLRGPCPPGPTNEPAFLRGRYPGISARIGDFRVGGIGSTYMRSVQGG